MNTIGLTMAGHAFRASSHKKSKEYENPLTDMVDMVIVQAKADEEIEHEKRQKAIIDLAYRYLNIVDCQKCGLPKRKGFNCLHCGNENG